jgi:hypothetical protein
MSTRSRRARLLLPIVAGTALVACGGAPTAGDYAERGQDFIAEGLDGQAERAGVAFSEPQCDDPPATSAGTIFTCTARGSDDTVYTFTVTIIGRNRMELVSEPPLRTPGSETTTASSAPAGPASTAAPTPTTVAGT